MPEFEIQRFVGLALLVGISLGCQRADLDIPARVETIVMNAGATRIASEDLSEPHTQRLRWCVRIGASWRNYRETVSGGLSEAGFRVTTIDEALVASLVTAGDSYLVEIRSMPTSGLELAQTVQIDLTGIPF